MLKPLAWYGGSWAYSDPDPEPEPEPVDPAQVWNERKAGFDPEIFGPPEPPREGRGLVVGRFLPPHRGHELLFQFARAFVRDLSILVRASPGDAIPAALRIEWIRELCPSVWVQDVPDPAGPPPDAAALNEHWTRVIRADLLPPDYVFGSDPSAAQLAASLGARYVPVDPERKLVPVSSTEVRQAPLEHWRFLPSCVRAHYARRVHLIGAERTGKTRLAQDLARHYHTAATLEYARVLSGTTGAPWRAGDTQIIARAQEAETEALARQCNRVLFCDTDLLSVEIWSERLFGGVPGWLTARSRQRPADLYLVLEPDGPAREAAPSDRTVFHTRLLEEIAARGLRQLRLSGDWADRRATAIRAVDALLEDAGR